MNKMVPFCSKERCEKFANARWLSDIEALIYILHRPFSKAFIFRPFSKDLMCCHFSVGNILPTLSLSDFPVEVMECEQNRFGSSKKFPYSHRFNVDAIVNDVWRDMSQHQ